MTADPLQLLELNGYSALESAQTKSPLTRCLVQAIDTGQTHEAEWIELRKTSPDRFNRLRHQWLRNESRQPTGSLLQRFLVDADSLLLRVIDLPVGRPLDEWIFTRQFSLAETLATTISLTRALASWHELSEIRGWLSCDSVYRNASNRIELRDHSPVEVKTQPEMLSLPVSELVFMPPESCGSLAREISPASDLYSVGTLMFGMLSGSPPIEAEDPSEYLDRQLCTEPPRLRELQLPIPQAVDDLVARLLRRDPRDRYANATALLADLEAIQAQLEESCGETSTVIGIHDTRRSITQPVLVGREKELAAMEYAFSQAAQGKPRSEAITGENATSRRLLMDECALRALASGKLVFRSRAVAATPKPLRSFEQVLQHINRLCESDAELAVRLAEATEEHAPTLKDLVPSLLEHWQQSGSPAGPEEYGSQRAAIALEQLLVSIATQRSGVVLMIDELDCADELTQKVVRSLVQRMFRDSDKLRLCVLTSGESIQKLKVRLSERPVRLGTITQAAMRLHLQSAAGVISPAVMQSIVEAADGNAMMGTAMLGRMVESGVVKPSDQGWIADGPLHDALRGDESYAELLDRQLNSLSAESVQLLGRAAVVGQQFALTTLCHVAECEYAEVLEIVSAAVQRGLLWKESHGGTFCFAHDQIHERLYQSIDPSERRELHLRTAEYLEREEEPNVFALSLHYDAAEQPDRALSCALQAAKFARERFSLSVAQQQLLIARRWVHRGDRVTGLLISEGLGEIALLEGRYCEAADHLSEALGMANTPFERARVQQQIGELAFKRGHFVEAANEYERALEITGIRVPGNLMTMLCGVAAEAAVQVLHTYLPRRFYSRRGELQRIDCLRLQLLSRLSHVYWFSRDKLWTLGNHLRSLNEAERFDPSETLAAFYSEHGPVMSLLRWFKRANRYASRSLQIRTERGNLWGQGQTLSYHSVVMLAECRFQDAIDTSNRGVQLLRQTGDLWEMNMARYQTANALYRIGRYADAAELASQIYYSGRQIGDLQATGIILDVWARSAPESLPLEIVTEEASRSRPDAQSHAQTQLGYAISQLHHQRIDGAIETLEEAIRRCENAGHLNTYISPCYAWLGTAHRRRLEETEVRDGRLLQQRLREAKRIVHRALRVARSFPADLAHCYRERAFLASMAGDVSGALRNLRKSLDAARRYVQVVEEHDTLQALRSLHQRHGDLLGLLPEQWKQRLEELGDQHGLSGHRCPVTEPASANLSLADRFVTVLQSGRRIAQALSPDVVYREASESARRLLRGQHVDVISIDREGSELTFALMESEEIDETQRARLKRDVPLLRAAMEQGVSVCNSNLSQTGQSTGSAIAAPIAYRGTPIALILVRHDDLKELFGEDERRIADFVATLAGAALENADGFRRLQLLNDTLEQRVRERTQAAEERARQLAESNQQLRTIEEQLRQAIDRANSANEAKGRFLATISHEIRTPLNGILGMTRLAQQSCVNQRQTSYLDTVQESGRSLLTLINDLLDVSKLESGKLELERIEVEPHQVAGEICRLMAASAWQKGVELVCHISPSVPATILGDPSRLRQIIMNLVGNAIKFTEEGFIALIVEVEEQADQSPHLVFRVQDSGIGIPKDKLDRVFDSFSQADSSTTRRYGGTGLGLTICRELTEIMGGQIAVSSEFGMGSEFVVSLPLEAVGQPPAPAADLSGKQVVVIEPLSIARQAAETALVACGASVTTFADPDAASESLSHAPDLWIVGSTEASPGPPPLCPDQTPCLYMIPANSVWHLPVGRRSAELRKPATPTEIVLAAGKLLEKGGEVSKDDGLKHPQADSGAGFGPAVDPSEPEHSGRVSAARQDPDRATQESSLQTSEDESKLPGHGIKLLVAEDGAINQEVIVGILEMQGYQVTVAQDGAEALRLAESDEFDLCLMDVDMPKMDGIEATRQIREHVDPSRGRSLPIVAMTAHSDDQIWPSCEQAGMNGHLSKPIEPQKLFEMIGQFTTDETYRKRYSGLAISKS